MGELGYRFEFKQTPESVPVKVKLSRYKVNGEKLKGLKHVKVIVNWHSGEEMTLIYAVGGKDIQRISKENLPPWLNEKVLWAVENYYRS